MTALRSRTLAALLLVTALVGVAACDDREAAPDHGAAGDGPGTLASGTVEGPPDLVLPDPDVADLLAGVHHAALADLGDRRLAEGLVPPTNRWFSGIVFGDPQPVFPRPLSVAAAGGGVEVGLPRPVTDAAAIVGPHVAAITFDVGAVDHEVVAHDDASVTLALLDGTGTVLGTVVVAQGSPFLPLTAGDGGLEVSVVTSADRWVEGADGPDGPDGFAVRTVDVDGRTWVVLLPEEAADAVPPDGPGAPSPTFRLGAGQTVVAVPVPDGADAEALERLLVAGADPVTGTEVTIGLDDVARTTLGYRTAGGRPTAYVTMPHHRNGDQPERADCVLGSYPSVYGTLEVCAGSLLTSWAPRLDPVAALDLDGLDAEHRDAVLAQLPLDVADTPDPPSDTYFGGKWLYRAATLVTLGEQLGAHDVVADLRAQTVELLREWAEPDGCARRDHRCFAYDADARSVVGLVPSFGSEELNDHHFHHGYHLAAAGMLAVDDPALAADLAPVLDLVALDIAHSGGSDAFPRWRTFDLYAGHSWASGTSPFADGNNQESSSEAVNAWNGLGLWAQARGQDDLADVASWLMSTEAAAALYWTALDLDDPVYDGYEHQVVALNWGAKRDWATWFSPEPSAMLGILLIPMGPYAGYLAAAGPEHVVAAVEEASPDGPDVLFGDYLLMYRALAGPEQAQVAWDAIGDVPEVDDGTSRAWLMAFVAAHL